LPETAVSMPPLTTVQHDVKERSRLALSVLFAMIADEISEAEIKSPYITPVELVIREST
jgi:DNA-binding LacI/PurR family transcriptional regulator